MTFCDLTIYNDNPYWSDFVPNSTFSRILSGFHRTFATGVACRQGTLTPPDTWSRPFGICIYSTCWDQSFSELVVILPDYALRISLGTFSILLMRYFKIQTQLTNWCSLSLQFHQLYLVYPRQTSTSRRRLYFCRWHPGAFQNVTI